VIPPAVKAYNKFIGAVDSFDQYRSYIRLELRSSEFGHPMMWFVIEAELVNSWVLYKTTMEKAGKPLLYTALTFRKALALALASEWESMGCTLNDAVISPTKPFQSLHAKAARQKVVSTPTCDRFTCVQKHTQHQEKIPQKKPDHPDMEPKRRQLLCCYCKKKRTEWWCKRCAAPLCTRSTSCFLMYHTKTTQNA
jgi:hypothetical protein